MTETDKFRIPGQFRQEDFLLGEHIPIENFHKVRNLELELTDVVVAAYPKTGTTLLQEMVWLIQNKADTEKANQTPNIYRVPFIELEGGDALQLFAQLPRPRAMKTHVPYRYLPITARQGSSKIVYIIRNPKDTLVSYYHFHRMNRGLGNFKGTWNDFFEYFKDNDNLLLYGNPIQQMKTFWEHKEDDNMYIVFYEDVIKQPKTEIRKLAEYLNYDLDDDALDRVKVATSFDVMKSNPMTNMNSAIKPVFDHSISPFFRKGIVGDWKNYFNDEQNKLIEDMEEEILGNTGLRFTYE